MRHRMGIGGITGLGNSSPVLLDNKGQVSKAMLAEAIDTFPLMKKIGGCDFTKEQNKVKFGIEPAYQYEPLEIVCVAATKENSYKETGRAWEAYGSGIAKKRRYYSEYQRKSKFVRFVDKWHPVLFGAPTTDL